MINYILLVINFKLKSVFFKNNIKMKVDMYLNNVFIKYLFNLGVK